MKPNKAILGVQGSQGLLDFIGFFVCMHYWLVYHWLRFIKDLPLMAASIEVEIGDIYPALQ